MLTLLTIGALAQHHSDHQKFYDYVTPTYKCGKGYDLIDGRCVKSVSSYPIPYCTKGYYKDGYCVEKFVEKSALACPDGDELIKDKCVAVVSVPEEIYCKEGEYVTGKCHSKKHFVPKTYCPDKTKLENGECVAVTKVVASLVCPTDYELVKDKCIRTEYANPIVTCPKDYEHVDNYCVQYYKPSLQCPKGFKYNRTNDNCIKSVKVSAEYSCPTGFKNVGKKCQKDASYPAEPVCKKGFVYNAENDSCYTVIEEKPMGQCEAGDHYEKGQCYAKKLVEATPICLDSSSPDNGDKCTEYSVTPAKFSCEKNEEVVGDKCVKYKPQYLKCDYGYLVDGEICAKDLYIKADYVCDQGELKYGKCYTYNSEVPEVKCPDNTIFDDTTGKCYYPPYAPSTKCPLHHTPTGSGECVKSTYSPATPVCPPDTELKGKMCVSYSEDVPSYECKKGHMINDLCIESDIIKPFEVCPKEYKLNKKGVCEKYIKPDHDKPGKVVAPKIIAHEKNSVENFFRHEEKSKDKSKDHEEKDYHLVFDKVKTQEQAKKIYEDHYKKAVGVYKDKEY